MSITHSQKGLGEKNRDRESKQKMLMLKVIQKFCIRFSRFLYVTDGDCSHEIKRRLLLGKKVRTNLDSILKSRDITLSTKVCLVKAMVFQGSCMDVRVGL